MTGQLNNRQINSFKTRLKQRFMALRKTISAELLSFDQGRYGDLAGRVHDIGDEALADLLVDIELASIDRHIQEIRDIDAALMRIAEGRYGKCCDCNDMVATERLEAYPTAQRCLICQELHDRTFVHANQPNL